MSINRLAILIVCALCVLAAPCVATVDTVLVADGDHDAHLSNAHAVYTTSCGGDGAVANTTLNRVIVGDRESGVTYTNYKGFLRFDIKDLHGTVNSATLYMYCHNRSGSRGDVYVLRPTSYWWPADGGDWTGAADTLCVFASEDITSDQWETFTLETAYIPMGRYLDIRLEDEYQQTCLTPPDDEDQRWSFWRSKDFADGPADTTAPYLVIDYDSTPVTCANVYVPSNPSDGYLSDRIPDVCNGIGSSPLVAATVIVAGETLDPDACYGYIRFDVPAIADSIQSAWVTFTVDAKGAANFGNVTFWKLDEDWFPLGPPGWGASGEQVGLVPYASVTPGETIAFDVTSYVTGGVMEPFQIQTSALCDEIEPIGPDETVSLRSREYGGDSVPVMTVCYFVAVDGGIAVGITDGSLGDASGKFMGKAGK